jgi:hypothetical protein
LLTTCGVVLFVVLSIAQTRFGSVSAVHERPQRHALAVSAPSAPNALSSSTHAHIAAEIGRADSSYHASAQGRGVALTNPEHGIGAEFTARGVTFRKGTHEWITALRGYGYGDRLLEADSVKPSASLNRVEYRRGTLTEWYVNGPLGIEQGFTLEEAPGRSNGEPLTLAFALSGNLTATADPGGRGLTLLSRGNAALRYAGLTAADARGRELHTWIKVAAGKLQLHVDDRDAAYPLTIDPFVFGAKLTTAFQCSTGICDEGEPENQFGRSVAMSADGSTLVVGVPGKILNGVRTGAAYVFVRPLAPGGWNSGPIYYTTRLYALDGATAGLSLGVSVAISADGATVAVGARGSANGQPGAAYVFKRPGASWSGVLAVTQAGKLRASSPVYEPSAFGASVAMTADGATVVVGSPFEGQSSTSIYGKVYVFRRPAIGWGNMVETQVLSSGLVGGLMSGWSLAVSGDGSTIVVGAVMTETYKGAAWVSVLQQSTNTYVPRGNLKASDGLANAMFGYSVSINSDGSVIVVGAPTRDYFDQADPGPGAAYVFDRPLPDWGATYDIFNETGKLTASDGLAGDSYGTSVHISASGNAIAVGASQVTIGGGPFLGPGAVYVFAKPAGGWSTATENTKVSAPDAWSPSFGEATAMSGDGTVLVAGAPYAQIANKSFQGAAFVYTGSALAPEASVSPGNLLFGPQAVGTTSSPQTVTVTNTGAALLSVSNVAVTGPFTATENCVSASPIAPAASCTATVSFAPATSGAVAGTLTFTSDSGGASGTTDNVLLQGVGTKAESVTTITSLSPSPALIGEAVTIAYSVAPAAGVTVAPSGAVTVQASTGESCTGDAPQGSCTISFPTAADRTITAVYSGDDVFNSSTSPTSQLRIGDFALVVSPASQTVSGKKKGAYKVAVTSVNGFAGAVSLACSGGPAGATCAVSPTSLGAGSGLTAKAAVTLPASAPKGTYTLTFTGSIGPVTRSATATLIVR